MEDQAFSPTLGKIIPAYVAAKKAIGSFVAKDKTNPHFKNKYASLEAVIDAVAGALLDNGIVFLQRNEPSHDGVTLVTELVHVSGEWIRSSLWLPVSKADAQGYGSAISYARRYGLQAICGLAADDDDGELAARRPSAPQAPASGPEAVEMSHKALEVEATLCRLLEAASNVDMLAAAAAEVSRAKNGKAITDAGRKRLGEVYSRKEAQFSAQQGAS